VKRGFDSRLLHRFFRYPDFALPLGTPRCMGWGGGACPPCTASVRSGRLCGVWASFVSFVLFVSFSFVYRQMAAFRFFVLGQMGGGDGGAIGVRFVSVLGVGRAPSVARCRSFFGVGGIGGVGWGSFVWGSFRCSVERRLFRRWWRWGFVSGCWCRVCSFRRFWGIEKKFRLVFEPYAVRVSSGFVGGILCFDLTDP
jgi:hypothetical protein